MFSIGKDSYFFGRMAPGSLGAKPELVKSQTYVPLNFISEILKAHVSVEGNIIKIVNVFCEEIKKPNLSYKFDNDRQGWEGGFADLPDGELEGDFYELAYEYTNIPVEGKESKGLMLSGNNHSDDLFMYDYKKISGLKPNTNYSGLVNFDLATNVPGGMMGIGGSPGSAVSVKAGIVGVEPKVEIDSQGYLRMNIDQGIQSNGGKDMKYLGNIEKLEGSADMSYQYKSFEVKSVDFTSNEKGEAWVILGVDSGFEGITVLYLVNINISYEEVNGTKDKVIEDKNFDIIDKKLSEAGEYSVSYPQVDMVGELKADYINQDLRNVVDKYLKSKDNLGYVEMDYKVTYKENDYFSIVFEGRSEYEGGEYPILEALVYETRTGKRIKAENLIKQDQESIDNLNELFKIHCEKQGVTPINFGTYMGIYFTNDDIVFYFLENDNSTEYTKVKIPMEIMKSYINEEIKYLDGDEMAS